MHQERGEIIVGTLEGRFFETCGREGVLSRWEASEASVS
jgi:hypothetical protein